MDAAVIHCFITWQANLRVVFQPSLCSPPILWIRDYREHVFRETYVQATLQAVRQQCDVTPRSLPNHTLHWMESASHPLPLVQSLHLDGECFDTPLRVFHSPTVEPVCRHTSKMLLRLATTLDSAMQLRVTVNGRIFVRSTVLNTCSPCSPVVGNVCAQV